MQQAKRSLFIDALLSTWNIAMNLRKARRTNKCIYQDHKTQSKYRKVSIY